MKTIILVLSLASSAIGQEIVDYMERTPLGIAMEKADQKAAREAAAQKQATDKILRLGLWARVTIANGGAQVGDVFPFMGFVGQAARVQIADDFIHVRRDSVVLFKIADEPQEAAHYGRIVAAREAAGAAADDRSANDAQNAAAARRARQDRINADWNTMQTNQALQDLNRKLDALRR